MYKVFKDDEGLHIYCTQKNMFYTFLYDNRGYAWIASLKGKNILDWNDHLSPTMNDIKFINEVNNDYDNWLENSEQDIKPGSNKNF